MTHHATPSFFASKSTPRGDGSYVLAPGKPLPDQLRVSQCARIAGVSVQTIYRLYHDGALKGRRASRGAIRIFAHSLRAHLAATEDQEYWDQ